MAGSLITTTRRGDMRPLAVQGIFATDCYHQLHSLLEQRLGSAHARLLAEPVHDPARENVDWYSSAEGMPTQLSALPPEQADDVRGRIGRMAAEIRAAAEEIGKDTDNRRALSGQLLLLCLQHPHEDDLWLVGEQPLVCCWGFAPGTLGAQPEDLTRLGPGRPGPKAALAAAPVPVAAKAGCLAWLLPLLLLLALLWLLLCRFGLLPLPGGCPPVLFGEDARGLHAERERGAQGLREIENLRAELLRRAEQCVPPPPPPKEPDPPPPPTEPEVTPPLVEPFLGESPSTPPPPPKPKEPPKPKPEPKPEPKPDPKPEPKPAPQKDAPLVIPDDARQKNDLSFLDGCWRCETGLVNSRTRRPVIVEYCFDKNGNGRRSVDERGGATCNGPARAGFDNGGKLRIEAGNAPCPGGSNYVPQTVECTGSSNATHCKGQEHYDGGGKGGGLLGRLFGEGNSHKWDAKFYRK